MQERKKRGRSIQKFALPWRVQDDVAPSARHSVSLSGAAVACAAFGFRLRQRWLNGPKIRQKAG